METTLNFASYSLGFYYFHLSMSKIRLISSQTNTHHIDLFYKDERIKVELKLDDSASDYIKNLFNANGRQKTYRNQQYSIIHRAIKYYDLHIEIPLSAHEFQSYLNGNILRLNSNPDHVSDLQFQIEWYLNEKDLDHLWAKQFKAENTSAEIAEHSSVTTPKKKKKKKKSTKDKANKKLKSSTQELIETFKEYERLQANSQVQDAKILNKKGIYLKNPKSFRKCENCANYTSTDKCSSHNIQVSENHSCSRFYSYKTWYGGSFSPK
ncbi:hypothetical protein M3172_24000 [Mesobacillus subterraneus]|uniref:hypothetical protein n=1 Tax=Mesobacillus subterraneus TaxID=285983 RepID=UPI00203A6088|nr:hypothetical protein [Mesobacillus subterraneus]MCM3576239.1 hypothetical protein [Mesobacillus subterraneus]